MANLDNAIGLRPHRKLAPLEAFTIASGYAANIGRGDVVEMTGTGKNIQVAAGGNADNLGVFWACQYTDANGDPVEAKHWPSGTVAADAVALVYADPHTVFRAQADALAEADVGLLADWDDGAMSAATGKSGREVAASAGAATGAALRIIGLVDEPGNDYGAHADVEVVFAEHIRLNVVAGVGGV
ncbi:MAG: hypothetical protein WBG92_11450 [Thiohalocapsa sp.]